MTRWLVIFTPLGLIVTGVLFFSVLHLQSIPEVQSQYVISHERIRILEERNIQFGFAYTGYLFSQHAQYDIISQHPLKVGEQYAISGPSITYALSGEHSFESWRLAHGVKGSIKLEDAKKLSCDAECLLRKNLNQTKRYVNQRLIYLHCHTFLDIHTLFAQHTSCLDSSGFASGLLIGDTSNIRENTYEAIVQSGVSHLVAVSGFQVIILVSCIESFWKRFSIDRRIVVLSIFLSLIGLILLVGPQPPVIRSGLSVTLQIIFLYLFGRSLSSWRALTYSAIVMILLAPTLLLSISFQLSFLATLGLIFGGALASQLKLPQNLFSIFITLFIISFSTYMWTLPIVISISQTTNVHSIWLNIILTGLTPFLSAIHALSLLPFLGTLFGFVGVGLNTIVLELLHVFQRIFPPLEMQHTPLENLFVAYGLIGSLYLLLLIFVRYPQQLNQWLRFSLDFLSKSLLMVRFKKPTDDNK